MSEVERVCEGYVTSYHHLYMGYGDVAFPGLFIVKCLLYDIGCVGGRKTYFIVSVIGKLTCPPIPIYVTLSPRRKILSEDLIPRFCKNFFLDSLTHYLTNLLAHSHLSLPLLPFLHLSLLPSLPLSLPSSPPGYVIGFTLTYIVLIVVHSPQPALLYLVPSTMLPPILIALARGQLNSLMTWVRPHLFNYKLILRT